jgi:hypothetical protein
MSLLEEGVCARMGLVKVGYGLMGYNGWEFFGKGLLRQFLEWGLAWGRVLREIVREGYFIAVLLLLFCCFLIDLTFWCLAFLSLAIMLLKILNQLNFIFSHIIYKQTPKISLKTHPFFL